MRRSSTRNYHVIYTQLIPKLATNTVPKDEGRQFHGCRKQISGTASVASRRPQSLGCQRNNMSIARHQHHESHPRNDFPFKQNSIGFKHTRCGVVTDTSSLIFCVLIARRCRQFLFRAYVLPLRDGHGVSIKPDFTDHSTARLQASSHAS